MTTYAFREEYTYSGEACPSTLSFAALLTLEIGGSTFYPSPRIEPISLASPLNSAYTTYHFPDVTIASVASIGSYITIVHRP